MDKNKGHFSNEEAIKIAIGGASTTKMPEGKRMDLLYFLRASASAYINGLSAVAKATTPSSDKIHGIAKSHLVGLLEIITDKLKEIEEIENGE